MPRLIIKPKDRARRVWGIKTTPKIKQSAKVYKRNKQRLTVVE